MTEVMVGRLLFAGICIGIVIDWLYQAYYKRSSKHVVVFPEDNFVDNVLTFTGTFEPLYHAVHKSDVSLENKINIYEDWCLRLRAVCNDDIYTKYVNGISSLEISERLELLLQEIVSCGVVRDDRLWLVVDDETACRYIDWEGSPLVVGEKVKVASASWSLNGKCIEKGIVIKNK